RAAAKQPHSKHSARFEAIRGATRSTAQALYQAAEFPAKRDTAAVATSASLAPMLSACAGFFHLPLSLMLRGLWVADDSGATMRIGNLRMIVHLHFLRARNSGAFMQNDRAWAAIVGLNDIAIGA